MPDAANTTCHQSASKVEESRTPLQNAVAAAHALAHIERIEHGRLLQAQADFDIRVVLADCLQKMPIDLFPKALRKPGTAIGHATLVELCGNGIFPAKSPLRKTHCLGIGTDRAERDSLKWNARQ